MPPLITPLNVGGPRQQRAELGGVGSLNLLAIGSTMARVKWRWDGSKATATSSQTTVGGTTFGLGTGTDNPTVGVATGFTGAPYGATFITGGKCYRSSAAGALVIPAENDFIIAGAFWLPNLTDPPLGIFSAFTNDTAGELGLVLTPEMTSDYFYLRLTRNPYPANDTFGSPNNSLVVGWNTYVAFYSINQLKARVFCNNSGGSLHSVTNRSQPIGTTQYVAVGTDTGNAGQACYRANGSAIHLVYYGAAMLTDTGLWGGIATTIDTKIRSGVNV